MRSDNAWHAGHAAGVVPSAVAFVVAIISSLIGLGAPNAYWGAIVACVVGFMMVVIRGSAAARATELK